MKIIALKPQHHLLWQKLVHKYPTDVFHSPAWLKALNATYNFDIKALILLDDEGEPRSGLVYSRIEDMMARRIVSLPFSDFCDPLVHDRTDWDLLISSLSAEDCQVKMRCLHNDFPINDPRLTLVSRAKWHCINLQRNTTDLWLELSGAARRAIKKAERQGITIRLAANKVELRAFFLLHLKLRKYKYSLLAQPYHFFENIWDNFIPQGHGALMLAIYEDQIIGGVFFLEWQNKLYYKFNASDQHQLNHRPNDLIVWTGIQYGQARGYEYLDFGLSNWDQEGLLQFKRKFATKEGIISYLQYMPEGAPDPKEKQIRSLLPQLTDLLVHPDVPDEITEKGGDILYPFFT